MSALGSLEALVKETTDSFVTAKSDGVLTVSEVIKIAVNLSQKVQKVAGLAGSEKKAMLLMTLKKGLEASGGVEFLSGHEEQLINAAVASVEMVLLAASGGFDFKKPSSWRSCLPVCLSMAKQVMAPKDAELLAEAVKSVAPAAPAAPVVAAPVVAAPVAAVTLRDPAAPADAVAEVKSELPGESAN